MEKVKSDLFYQKTSPLGLFHGTVKTGVADWAIRGCFHYLNELNLLLQGFENIFKVHKIISLSSKLFYWQRWINMNSNLILPDSFQVYLVKQGTSKRRRVAGVICVRYLCRQSLRALPAFGTSNKELVGQFPCISSEEYKSGENVIGSGNMITHITVDESPTVGIK